ncbi:darcynin family protein [Burkholderia sp. LMG 32019]|uniref:darcynin family protein n=1 Tax=Burkholderia sp. LMG 32019 TaxID=3158173 RepID=UPI003C2D9521
MLETPFRSVKRNPHAPANCDPANRVVALEDACRIARLPRTGTLAPAARTHRADHRHSRRTRVAALRETSFRHRHFDIVEIVPGVESAGASTDGDIAPSTARAHAARKRDACAACAQSFFPRHPRKKTTVATCGTTVVVRDSTVTLWA